MPRLTKSRVDEAKTAGRVAFVWDSDVKGYGLRVTPAGAKAFVIQYRTQHGTTRRMTIGSYGALTPDEARRIAREKLVEVARGGDPAADRQRKREAADFNALLDSYLADHVVPKNAPKTREGVERILKLYVRPAFGARKVIEIARSDIQRLHASMKDKPRSANLTLSVLSKVFNLAEQWGHRPDHSNPCRGVVRYPEQYRERFLRASEIVALGEALREAETVGLPWKVDVAKPKAKHLAKEENRRTLIAPEPLAAIRLLLLTGARRAEIVTLRWEHVDAKAGTIALPGQKGKVRRPHPAPVAALALLASLDRSKGSPWVLPRSSDPSRHLSPEVVESTWQRVRRQAGLEDVRLHDLRHTVGTAASQAGANAFLVRDMLRHKTVAMTSRYVNRDEDPLRDLVDAIGARIDAGLSGLGGAAFPVNVWRRSLD